MVSGVSPVIDTLSLCVCGWESHEIFPQMTCVPINYLKLYFKCKRKCMESEGWVPPVGNVFLWGSERQWSSCETASRAWPTGLKHGSKQKPMWISPWDFQFVTRSVLWDTVVLGSRLAALYKRNVNWLKHVWKKAAFMEWGLDTTDHADWWQQRTLTGVKTHLGVTVPVGHHHKSLRTEEEEVVSLA